MVFANTFIVKSYRLCEDFTYTGCPSKHCFLNTIFHLVLESVGKSKTIFINFITYKTVFYTLSLKSNISVIVEVKENKFQISIVQGVRNFIQT